MKQIIIAFALLLIAIVIISVSDDTALKTISGIMFIAAAGFLVLGVANIVYKNRNDHMTFDK